MINWCTKPVAKHHRRLNCDSCQKRCHIKCGNVSVKDYNRLAVKTIYKWNCPSCLVCLQTTEPNDHINLGLAPPQLQPGSEPTNNDIVHAIFQNESDKLKIAHINIRSLLPSKNMVELFLDNSRIDILVITETWLSNSIDPQATAIENYRCDLRQDRDGKKGGGIIIYYKSHLSIEKYHDLCLPASETNSVEQLWVKAKIGKGKPLLIAAVYRPPDSPVNQLTNLERHIAMAMTTDQDIIITGDLNCDFLRPESTPSKHLKEIISTYSLKQHIEEATRVTETSSTLIDIVVTRQSMKPKKAGVLHCSLSDHSLVYIILYHKCPPAKAVTKKIRSYKSLNKESFREDLSNLPLSECAKINDADTAVMLWNQLYLGILNKHAPEKTIKVRPLPKPWFTKELKEKINRKNDLRKAAVRLKSPDAWGDYRREKQNVRRAVDNAKDQFFKNLLEENKNNHSQLWKSIKRLIPSKKDNIGIPHEWSNKKIATDINKFFVNIGPETQKTLRSSQKRFLFPFNIKSQFSFRTVLTSEVQSTILGIPTNKSTGYDGIGIKTLKIAADIVSTSIARLINLSLATGECPVPWKTAQITPVYKSGDKLQISNYRPISILPLLSKIMEKLIAKQIWEYLNANKILDKYYSGFRKNHSTETALTYITDEILTNMGNRLVTPTVLMDLSKAFDSIDHSMMLTKLFNYGFDCHAVFWFASYLRNRPQVVKVNSVISDQESLKCGVPQGSVLGPVLFVLYINEIPAIVAKYVQNSTSEVSIHGYADDLQLFSSCTTQSLEACILNLEQCCKTILDWFSQNKLKANPDKFQFIIYGTKQQHKNIPAQLKSITINETSLTATSVVKNLGMKLDENLTWKDHITNLKGTCAGRLIQLSKVRGSMSKETFKNVVNATVISKINYGDIVYASATSTNLQKVQQIQNFAARVIHRVPRRHHTSELIRQLDWMKTDQMRHFHRLSMMYKCLNGMAPLYLSENFKYNRDIHSHYTRQASNLHVPMSTSSSHQRTFYGRSIQDFNALPTTLKQAQNFGKFKFSLKAHFLTT